MTELSDKLTKARGGGHHVAPAVEAALLSMEARLDKLEGKKDPDKKEPSFSQGPGLNQPAQNTPYKPPNPMDGARLAD